MFAASCIDDGRGVSTFRVLVVEDYEPFRQFVRSTLGTQASLQIVGEASDGLEALQKTAELHPHLLVLDIGLPTLNGIEVARRIREFSLETKILFVSQETCGDVVQAALHTGALGYVIKARAGRDLLGAVDAICQGIQFVSSEVAGLASPEIDSSGHWTTQP